MKKQYNYSNAGHFQYKIYLYHDGKLIKTDKCYMYAADDKIEELEKAGYTYGYTAGEIESIEKQYKNMLDNIIVSSKEFWHIVPINNGCEVLCRNTFGDFYFERKENSSKNDEVLVFSSEQEAQTYINDWFAPQYYKPEEFWRLGTNVNKIN